MGYVSSTAPLSYLVCDSYHIPGTPCVVTPQHQQCLGTTKSQIVGSLANTHARGKVLYTNTSFGMCDDPPSAPLSLRMLSVETETKRPYDISYLKNNADPHGFTSPLVIQKLAHVFPQTWLTLPPHLAPSRPPRPTSNALAKKSEPPLPSRHHRGPDGGGCRQIRRLHEQDD